MDQVKSLIREHLERNRFFDTLKQAVAKDPRLATIDKGAIIEKIKSEGILNDILQQIPTSALGSGIQKKGAANASMTPVD